MSKKIVFINQSTGFITIDTINAFVEAYDQVELIYGTMTPNKFPLHPKVKKVRVMKKTRASNVGRFIRWLIASIQIQFLLMTKYRGFEIFYYTLPPFSYLGALLLNKKFSIMVFDVYPDVLKTINIGENNIIYRLWGRANQILFRRAHRVYTISDGLKCQLSAYVPSEKIHAIPLWMALSDIVPVKKVDNIFSREQGFENKFVVQYSGNIGQAHNVEILVDIAADLSDYADIQFVIIGRGQKSERIKALIAEKQLINCVLLPFQPEEMIKYSLANAEIGVVMIDDKAAQMSVPSKIYNMMAVGSTILAIAPPASELAKIITQFKNGACFSQTETEAIKAFILKMYANQDELANYRNNSLKASKNFTIRNALKIFDVYEKQ